MGLLSTVQCSTVPYSGPASTAALGWAVLVTRPTLRLRPGTARDATSGRGQHSNILTHYTQTIESQWHSIKGEKSFKGSNAYWRLLLLLVHPWVLGPARRVSAATLTVTERSAAASSRAAAGPPEPGFKVRVSPAEQRSRYSPRSYPPSPSTSPGKYPA